MIVGYYNESTDQLIPEALWLHVKVEDAHNWQPVITVRDANKLLDDKG